MKSHSRSRRITAGLLGGFLVVAVPAAFLTMAAGTPEAPEQAVRIAVRQALEDVYDAATFKFPDWTEGKLSADRVAQVHNRLEERLNASLTGNAYTAYSTALHNTIDTSSTGQSVVVTAGGVDRIEYHDVSVEGSRATVSGRNHAWVTWVILDKSVRGSHAARPEGWEQFAAELVLVDGNWLVSELHVRPIAP